MPKVVNKNRSPYRDIYGGIIYEFPVNEGVNIPEAAANHLFGYNGSKKDACFRMGLTTREQQIFLDNFHIS